MHYKISYPKVDIVSILSSLLCVCPECRVILLASQCKHYSAHKKSMRTNEMEEFMLEWTLPHLMENSMERKWTLPHLM